jgi:putative nucleotidyltransferase with HDIG domain
MTEAAFDGALRALVAFCASQNMPAWLVGGTVRDMARGHAPADIDLAVAGDGLALARAFADAHGASFVALDAERATGRAVIPGEPALTVDLAALRAPTIEGDLRLRDFTLNAMALPLTAIDERPGTKDKGQAGPARPLSSPVLRPASLIDPTGGLADLEAGLLRQAGPTSLTDDPLRVLRAGRLIATMGLTPVAELKGQLQIAAPGLARVAAERARDELLKLLDAPVAAPALRYLDSCGALTTIFPELEPARTCEQPGGHFLPVLAHMLETVAALDWLIDGRGAGEHEGAPAIDGPWSQLPVAVQRNSGLRRELPFAPQLEALLSERRAGGHRRAALLKLAGLLHDNAKPQTKERHPDGTVSFHGHQDVGAEVARSIARRLRLSKADTQYATLVVREHMRPGQLRTADVLTTRAVTRFFRDLGDAGPDVLLHELADHLATRGSHFNQRGWAAHLAWVELMLSHYYLPPPEGRAPLVDGHGLMRELELKPGPLIGQLLREIAEAQAAGEVKTREEALALAQGKLSAED